MSSTLLFLGLCIPLRILTAVLSQKIDDKYLKYLGVLFLVFGLSFMYLYFGNKRLESTEAGGPTWWAHYRLIIGAFYLVAAVYAFQGRKDLVWIPLVMDILFGLVIFCVRHKLI